MKLIGLKTRIILFAAILVVGTSTALMLGETEGLALATLSEVPISTVDAGAGEGMLYATLATQPEIIYRSDDFGRSWQKIGAGPDGRIQAFTTSPVHRNQLFAAPQNGDTVWYSSDGGQQWQSIDLSLTATPDTPTSISALAAAPDDSGLLYAGTNGSGLYRIRTETGSVVALQLTDVENLYVKDIAATKTGRVYAATTEGLVVWQGDIAHKLDTLPDTAVSLAVGPGDDQTLYAGTVAYGLYVTHDDGKSWQSLNDGLGWQPGLILRVSAIAVDDDNPRHLAVATAFGVGSQLVGDGIYESFNAGEHWVKIANSQEVVGQLTVKGGGVYAGTTTGLARYGNPLPEASFSKLLHVDTLTNPTGVQLLVLVLTVALAGWVLLGPSTRMLQQT